LNYATGTKGGALEKVPKGIIPPVKHLTSLPFPGQASKNPGRVWETYLIEPPTYLPRLVSDLKDRGVQIEQRTFESVKDVHQLRESAIVDCMGLGAKEIFNDSNLIPYRGHLVHLKPDRKYSWLLVHSGYIFPRSDSIVLGGSWERGETSLDPNPKILEGIFKRNKNFFI